MSGRLGTEDTRRAIRRGALNLSLATLAALGGSGAARAELTINPSLGTNALWIDNVMFAPQNEPQQSDEMFLLAPSLRILQKADRLTSSLRYDLNAEYFAHDSRLNQMYHDLDARGEADVISKMLFFGAYVEYSQVLTSPTTPQYLGGSIPVGTLGNNLANVFTAGVRPRFQKEFKDTTLSAMYTEAKVDYRSLIAGGLPTPNSTVSMINSSWGTNEDSKDRVTFALSYDSRRARYDNTYPDFRFDRANAEVGFRIVQQFSVFGSGGAETDLTKGVSSGGLNAPRYEGGVRWIPLETSSLELAAGHESYGNSYRARALYSGRVLKVDLKYTDQATTLSNQLGLLTGTAPGEATPTQLGYLPGALQGVGTPAAASTGFQRITGSVYVSRDLDGTVSLVGRRTEIELLGYSHEREYLNSTGTDHESGVTANVKRKLSPRMTAMLEVSRGTLTLVGNSAFDELDYRAMLDRQLTERSSLQLQLAHIRRTGTLSNFNANWALLGYQVKFNK
jgi:uncharacterized protein (PEP-CTERM system associated)